MEHLNKPGLIQRLRAAFAPQQPAQHQSDRMPDLERWVMPHRSVDMQDWQVAYNMATNVLRPDRTRLMDLYDSILVDSHLASTMESRVLRVQRSRFRLVQGGEPKPDLLPLLQQQWFEDFLRYTAEAAFRGHTLIELGAMAKPGELLDVHRIDPRNVLPWSGMVVRRQGEETGYAFREPPLNSYLIEVGRAEDLGLLASVAPVAIVKKYAVGSWSDYVHKYGIPPRWVKTNSRDVRRFKQLEAMMQNMLSSAYGVIEGDEEIQIMPTPGTDAHKVFDELISRMNSEISKRILGQDGTSDNKDASGTYGSLKVLQSVAEDRHQADKASAAYVINNELFPRLINLGYPLQGVRFEWDALQDLGPMELVDAVSKLGMVFDIDPKHVEERTGIKILGARRMPGELGPGEWPPAGGGNPPGARRQGGGNPPLPTEEDGGEEDEEDGVTASTRSRKSPAGWEYPAATCGRTSPKAASETRRTDEQSIEALFRSVWKNEYPWDYAHSTAKVLADGVASGWGRGMPQIAYDEPDHYAQAMMRVNIQEFSGIKAMDLAYRMNQMARESTGYGDFKRRVDESGILPDYDRNKLNTEYQMAVNTGVQSGRYYRMIGQKDSLPFWEYTTQGDDRVRDAHRRLDGKVFPWNDPVWATIYPPNGWRCRCTITQRFDVPEDQLTSTAEGLAIADQNIPADFRMNRSEAGVIFTRNTNYAKGLNDPRVQRAGDDMRLLYGLDTAYGADAPKVMLSASPGKNNPPAEPAVALNAKEAIQWVRDRRGANERLLLTDYEGVKWEVQTRMVEAHVTKETYKGQKRWETIHLMPEVLSVPDEVWTRPAKGGTDFTYLKFYGNKAMVVRARMAEDKGLPQMRVSTWYEMNREDENRYGVLAKKMPVDR
ncbi:MAG: DUF935 family protein [Bacteroidetes bacterium]|nr:DUF935 family protein [Bacteroidota bacterium]